MLSKMKRPFYQGVGRRNDTVEALKIDRALKEELEGAKALAIRSRPQAAPMTPGQRELNYRAQAGRSLTPAQRRRADKKERRGWRRPGSAVLTAIDEHEPLRPANLVDEIENRLEVSLTTSSPDEREELPQWDPEQCSCHINPPCHYCEAGEYQL